jgi:hypothetical protein
MGQLDGRQLARGGDFGGQSRQPITRPHRPGAVRGMIALKPFGQRVGLIW